MADTPGSLRSADPDAGTGSLRSPSSASSASTNKKDKPPPGDNDKLTPVMLHAAIAELRYQCAAYEACVQALMDGATLGAEAVQEKRLEALENGPITEAGDVIAAIVITLVLEGTIGAAIAAAAVSVFVKAFARNAERAVLAQSAVKAEQMIDEIRMLRPWWKSAPSGSMSRSSTAFKKADALHREFRTVAQQLRQEAQKLPSNVFGGPPPHLTALRDRLNEFADLATENVVAGAKAAVAGSAAAGTDQTLAAQPSPALDVRAAAMQACSTLRLSVIAMREALEVQLQTPDLTIGGAREILASARPDEPFDVASIRDSTERASEALIWAHLLINPNIMSRSYGGNTVPGGEYLHLGKQPYLPYLMVRFADDVERWASSTGAAIPPLVLDLNNASGSAAGERGVRPTGWFSQLTGRQREDFLIQFLNDIKTRTSDIFSLKVKA